MTTPIDAWLETTEPRSVHAVLAIERTHVPNMAEQLLRVLRPGGHVVARALNRRAQLSIALATCFEVRGAIARLYTPPTPTTELPEFGDVQEDLVCSADMWVVARSPMSGGTVAENLRQWGTGGFRRKSHAQPFGDVIAADTDDFLAQLVWGLLPVRPGRIAIIGAGYEAQAALRAAQNLTGYEAELVSPLRK